MKHNSLNIKTGLESDIVYAHHNNKYLKNRHSVVKFAKRQMNKRERKTRKEKIKTAEFYE
jgi:hypothetical protein